MAIYKSALDLVGNTPLLEVTHFEKELLRQLSKMQKRQASLSLTR